MHPRKLAPSLLVFVAVSCGGDTSMGGGTAGSPGVTAGMAVAAAPPAASWSQIYEMMYPMETNARCNACHANPANDVGNGNLHMGPEKETAYQALVGKTSGSSRCMQRPLVVPMQPEMSLLLIKLSPNPPCGSRMPVGGTPFTEAQLAMIRGWIAAGAKND